MDWSKRAPVTREHINSMNSKLQAWSRAFGHFYSSTTFASLHHIHWSMNLWNGMHMCNLPSSFQRLFSVETVSRISFCDLSFLNFSQKRFQRLPLERQKNSYGTRHLPATLRVRGNVSHALHLPTTPRCRCNIKSQCLGKGRRDWRDWIYRSFMIVSRMFFSGQAQRFKRFKSFAEVETPWGTPFLLRGLLQGP